MRVPLVTAYITLTERLGDPESLSWRKRVCLQFLKWGVYGKDEDCELFVQMAIAWRKKEKRVGGKRSIVEKRMRKLLQKRRKHKALEASRKGASEFFQKQKAEGTGIFDEEYRKTRMIEHNRNNLRKMKEAGRKPAAKDWIITEPDGTEVRVHGLLQYAKEKGLSQSRLNHTAKVKGVTHKGYRARLANDEWEGETGG